MPTLVPWVVYNKKINSVDITKGRRAAMRVAATYNKLFKLLNNKHMALCFSAKEFFECHRVEKENINFCWDIPIHEKMCLIKDFFYGNRK